MNRKAILRIIDISWQLPVVNKPQMAGKKIMTNGFDIDGRFVHFNNVGCKYAARVLSHATQSSYVIFFSFWQPTCITRKYEKYALITESHYRWLRNFLFLDITRELPDKIVLYCLLITPVINRPFASGIFRAVFFFHDISRVTRKFDRYGCREFSRGNRFSILLTAIKITILRAITAFIFPRYLIFTLP